METLKKEEIIISMSKLMQAYPELVGYYKKSQKSYIGFFVGQIMKENKIKSDVDMDCAKLISNTVKEMLES